MKFLHNLHIIATNISFHELRCSNEWKLMISSFLRLECIKTEFKQIMRKNVLQSLKSGPISSWNIQWISHAWWVYPKALVLRSTCFGQRSPWFIFLVSRSPCLFLVTELLKGTTIGTSHLGSFLHFFQNYPSNGNMTLLHIVQYNHISIIGSTSSIPATTHIYLHDQHPKLIIPNPLTTTTKSKKKLRVVYMWIDEGLGEVHGSGCLRWWLMWRSVSQILTTKHGVMQILTVGCKERGRWGIRERDGGLGNGGG